MLQNLLQVEEDSKSKQRNYPGQQKLIKIGIILFIGLNFVARGTLALVETTGTDDLLSTKGLCNKSKKFCK